MALKVKARERLQKIGKYAGEYRYQLMADLYTALTQEKVIREAALRSGVSQGVMQACWDAAGEVIKAWATEGHSVALSGLGFFSPCPPFTIQIPIPNGFCQMRSLDVLTTFKVGNGAGDFQDAVVGTGGEVEACHGSF